MAEPKTRTFPRAFPSTIHASGVVLDQKGVVVIGPSGSGKSRLCSLLIEKWSHAKRHARWVGDDRLLFKQLGHALVARAPDEIRGLAEQRFAGVAPVAYQQGMVVDLAVRLVSADQLERMPEPEVEVLANGLLPLPIIQVPKSDLNLAMELIERQLSQ